MVKKVDLSGVWNLQLDKNKEGLKLPFRDTMMLPGTTSYYKKGEVDNAKEIGFLTDEYKFEGQIWLSKEIEIPKEMEDKIVHLYLERTRFTKLWIDNMEVGAQNSLNTPHIYDVTKYLTNGLHTVTIMVDNTNYLTKGGHLTSPDTQTNWIGITGRVELQIFNKIYIEDLWVYPNVKDKTISIKTNIYGSRQGTIVASVNCFNTDNSHDVKSIEISYHTPQVEFTYFLGDDALLWSEFTPNLYELTIDLEFHGEIVDTNKTIFGLREFKASTNKFFINGKTTFLRGKHDGLIFPLTGFAPTTVEEWIKVLKISKSYGINHYRFHTCCPPEAAFIAADMLGIYLEPELPFWGTVTDEKDENHNQVEQDYLLEEGYAILKSFGNHPSFVMMSLGNELWGSKEKLNEILKGYKEFDNRHLYTQGSNNFQFFPVILEEDDFFCGVRLSKNRLFRGSYAMCDAPLGHIQTDYPNTYKDYDEVLKPSMQIETDNSKLTEDGLVEIQYGTEAKKVKASGQEEQLIPNIPVVSHEIGQYATYPNFDEINKYTGSLKARNFEVFYERLADKGLDHLAKDYFYCSGKLAMACYKEEMEAAFRSRELAGFQLLDLQDFSGQGTALVGVLDAFMESKGLITPEEWRSFCSDSVLMARFEKYNFLASEEFKSHIELTYFREMPITNLQLIWELRDENDIYEYGETAITIQEQKNYIDICDLSIKMPAVTSMKKLLFSLSIKDTEIYKVYELWIYPNEVVVDQSDLFIYDDLSAEAMINLEQGKNILLLPNPSTIKNSIPGFYSADFWCYPMFRSISEMFNKELPIGTMGLLIDNIHPALKYFESEKYSTYQWWNIVMNSCSIILDGTNKDLQPIIQTIDNFERNHKLGLLFECKVGNGKVLVCSCNFDKVIESVEGKQFFYSIMNYMKSEEFQPQFEMSMDELKNKIK
jgi:hypothetical protein